MEHLPRLLVGAFALAWFASPIAAGGPQSPWCCDLEREGHVATADGKALAVRYADWRPEALAGRLWSLALHRDHLSAHYHDAAHDLGRYEITGVLQSAAPERLTWRPGTPHRIVQVHQGRFEIRESRLTETEQASLRACMAEQLWLDERLGACRSEWTPSSGVVTELPSSRESFTELLSSTPVETVVGWYWALEATALATWKQILDGEFEQGNFDVVDSRTVSTCGNTHEFELPGERVVTLADGTVQCWRARRMAYECDEVRALLMGYFWVKDHLDRLARDHGSARYARGTAALLSICFPQPHREWVSQDASEPAR